MLNEVQPKDDLCRSQRLLCRKEKHVYTSLNPSNLANNVTGPLQYKLDCWLASSSVSRLQFVQMFQCCPGQLTQGYWVLRPTFQLQLR